MKNTDTNWEQLQSTQILGGPETWSRLEVPGGWLILVTSWHMEDNYQSERGPALTFLPDTPHAWLVSQPSLPDQAQPR